MSIKEMFSSSRTIFDMKAKTKAEAINELIEVLAADGKITDKEVFTQAVLKREEEFSTGIGFGIAIPHGKSNAVTTASIVFGRSKTGVDYESMDEKPAYLFFLIAVPEKSDDTHLRALGEISRRLMHADIREKLMNSENYEDIIEIF